MSNSNRTLDDLLALENGCATCDAEPGRWCRIRDGYKLAGQPAQFLHAGRGWATRHARWVGYTTGQVDALHSIRWALDHVDPTTLTPGARAWLEQELKRQTDQAERWAHSAHQRALMDVPEDWRR